MTDSTNAAAEMIQRQLKELDDIYKQAAIDLNTVAANEKVEKWRAKTVPLVLKHLGQKAALKLAATKKGPSFTSDFLEEVADHVETYRNALQAIAKEYGKPQNGCG